MNKTQHLERREHERLKAPEESILVSASRQEVFRLLDISEGGLSFRCLQSETLSSTWSANIFIGPASVHLKNISLQLIWEKPDNMPSFLSMPTKEVGVKFDTLDQSLKDQLEAFLLNQPMMTM